MITKIGAFYGFISSTFVCVSQLLSKHLVGIEKYNVINLASIAMVIMLTPIMVTMNRQFFKTEYIKILKSKDLMIRIFLRSFFGVCSGISLFGSMKYISIGDCNALYSLQGPVTGILAYLLLKEKFAKIEILFSILSVIGMVIVAQPFHKNENQDGHLSDQILGTLFCIVAIFASAMITITIRSVGKHVHYITLTYLQMVIWTSLFDPIFVGFGLIHLPYFGYDLKTMSRSLQNSTNPDSITSITYYRHDLKLLLCIAILIMLNLFAKKLFCETDKAVVVNLFSNVRVIIGYLIDIFILQTWPNGWSMVGSGIILVSVIGLGMAKIREN